MARLLAITRAISPRFNECELTHIGRTPIDVQLAELQHGAYEQALRHLGLELLSLPAEEALPDSVFVEDTALVLDDIAVITRPGAPSRQPEVEAVAQALAPYRALLRIEPPGTVDGGDILAIGRDVYVGISTRSNGPAIRQLQSLLEPRGYRVHGLPISGCLHLKSAVTRVAEDALLINPDWVERAALPALRFLEVDPREPAAANALWLPQGVIYPEHFPATGARLEAAGIRLVPVPASEVAKAEGAVTCCSLVFSA